MIKDYVILKKHCITPYSINNKKFNIGDLTDKQLDISKMILERKGKLTNVEDRQLKAVNYVINYRSEKALESIQEEYSKRLKDKGFSIANSISLWGDKVGDKIKFYDEEKKVIELNRQTEVRSAS